MVEIPVGSTGTICFQTVFFPVANSNWYTLTLIRKSYQRGKLLHPCLLPLARDERSDRDYFFTLSGALGEVFGFHAAASNRALATWSGVIWPSARARCW